MAWQIFKHRISAGRTLGLLLAGSLIPLGLFFVYNLQTTGNALVYTRLRPAYMDYTFPGYEQAKAYYAAHAVLTFDHLWHRFGANLTNNLLGLCMWFYAPVGFFVALFAIPENSFTKILGAGILMSLLLALGHDNYGIHLLGPLNYSELCPLLVILSVFGFQKLWTLSTHRQVFNRKQLITGLASAVLSSIIFLIINCSALRDQALIHHGVYSFLKDSVVSFWQQKGKSDGKAAIFAGKYFDYWSKDPLNQRIGSYVYEWQIPSPELSEDIIYLRDSPTAVTALKENLGRSRFISSTKYKFPPLYET